MLFPNNLERRNCRGWIGDYQITGKHGHILGDQPGYLLYVTGTVQRWKKAKRILPGVVKRMVMTRALFALIGHAFLVKPRQSGT